MPTSEPECPFCLIASDRDPDAHIVYEDARVVAFTPPEPATLGHTLLIPRHHATTIWALDSSDAEALARATLRVAEGVRAAMSPEGLNVVQSNGAAATQTVDHLHVHVVPKYGPVMTSAIWPESTDFTTDEKHEVVLRLRNQLRGGGPILTGDAPQALDGEDRRKHLEFPQAVGAPNVGLVCDGQGLAIACSHRGLWVRNDDAQRRCRGPWAWSPRCFSLSWTRTICGRRKPTGGCTTPLPADRGQCLTFRWTLPTPTIQSLRLHVDGSVPPDSGADGCLDLPCGYPGLLLPSTSRW